MDTQNIAQDSFWNNHALTGGEGKGISGRVTKAKGSAKVVTRTPSKQAGAEKRHKDLTSLAAKRKKEGKTLTKGQQTRLDALSPTVGSGAKYKSTRTSIGARTKKKRGERTKWRKRPGVKKIRSAVAKKQRLARQAKASKAKTPKGGGAKPKARTRRKAKK